MPDATMSASDPRSGAENRLLCWVRALVATGDRHSALMVILFNTGVVHVRPFNTKAFDGHWICVLHSLAVSYTWTQNGLGGGGRAMRATATGEGEACTDSEGGTLAFISPSTQHQVAMDRKGLWANVQRV